MTDAHEDRDRLANALAEIEALAEMGEAAPDEMYDRRNRLLWRLERRLRLDRLCAIERRDFADRLRRVDAALDDFKETQCASNI